MGSILEQYRISDFIEWYEEKKLKLNPHFQRGSVWTPNARTFLIDTILLGLPIPKIYLRTKIDIPTKRSYREVVDGQQRLRAIIDFADDKFTLTKRSQKFCGLKFSTLDPEDREAFLSYALSIDQMINASDDYVLEVFARLNSYSVQLNAPEKRHAKYQGELKWSIRQASRDWSELWEDFGIFTIRERVRMNDDSFMAEIYSLDIRGVTDGGQEKINKFYSIYDKNGDGINLEETRSRIDDVLEFYRDNLADDLSQTKLCRPAHLLMVLAAVFHAKYGIPCGGIPENEFIPSEGNIDIDVDVFRDNLLLLASIIELDEPRPGFKEFWNASRSTTQRIASRKVRFLKYFEALGGRPFNG